MKYITEVIIYKSKKIQRLPLIPVLNEDNLAQWKFCDDKVTHQKDGIMSYIMETDGSNRVIHGYLKREENGDN